MIPSKGVRAREKTGTKSGILLQRRSAMMLHVGDGLQSFFYNKSLAELAKKRWLQIRDRYRKELIFAIRDHFAYTPKWPYFNKLTWLDEFLKDSWYDYFMNRRIKKRFL